MRRVVVLGVAIMLMGGVGWARPKQIVLYRLANASHYRGSWDLRSGLSDKLADALVAKTKMKVIVVPSGDWERVLGRRYPSEAALSKWLDLTEKRFGKSFVLLGRITQFNFNRVQLTAADAFGWGNLKAECNIEFLLLPPPEASHKPSREVQTREWHQSLTKRRTNRYALANLESKSLQPSMSRLEKRTTLNSPVFDRSFLGQVVGDTMNKIADTVASNAGDPESSSEALARAVGKVVDLDGKRTAYLNLGSDLGVQKGLLLLVYRLGKPIKDPETGEVLGRREHSIATLKVERVISGRLSKARVTSFFGGRKRIFLGDLVRLHNNEGEGTDKDKDTDNNHKEEPKKP